MKFRRISGWGGTYVVPIIEEEIVEDESVTRIKKVTEHLRRLETEDSKAKKEKHLREGIEKLKEEFNKRKLKDKMEEHIAAILHELLHAMHNHPDDKWPWKSFDFVHQTAVMMEEAGEAVRAANNMRTGDEDQMALYAELAQTAAMCIRIMQQIKEYTINGKSGN